MFTTTVIHFLPHIWTGPENFTQQQKKQMSLKKRLKTGFQNWNIVHKNICKKSTISIQLVNLHFLINWHLISVREVSEATEYNKLIFIYNNDLRMQTKQKSAFVSGVWETQSRQNYRITFLRHLQMTIPTFQMLWNKIGTPVSRVMPSHSAVGLFFRRVLSITLTLFTKKKNHLKRA